MLCKALLVVSALILGATAAQAADLPAQTELGAMFADAPPRHVKYRTFEYQVVTLPWVANSPRVAGYYGTWGDFYYSSYYGTSAWTIWSRPPYSCAWYAGHCW
jgi:hypothetical protein